jgi:phosphoglycolate phosphatase-like HAD superfamily hydrolase
LVFDLDYLVFDCAMLKVRALRQSLISFADSIPQSVRLPDAIDAEEAFLQHGFRWTQFIEIGLDEERLSEVQHAYRIQEERLVQAGVGQIFPGVRDFIVSCREAGTAVALGAEASRDYLLAVSDRHRLDDLFDMALCTQDYGVGFADEMIEEIMRQSEVNPSETLVLATRPHFFEAAHNLDVLSIGCGWGIRRHDRLGEADIQSLTVAQIPPAILKADRLATEYLA